MKTTALLMAVWMAGSFTSVWAQSTERFTEANGALKDASTGLWWTQSDSGADTNWTEARDYCKRKRAGWRLPTAAELQAIYDAAQSTRCGNWTCRASPKFRLSGPWFWSSERRPSSEAAFVYLTTGQRNTLHVGNRYGVQALCVRQG